ncbi:MAG: matrixin family metalloprotease [Methanobacteriota archaeon]
MKTWIYVTIFVLLLSAYAAASMLIPANEKAREKAKAPEKSPVISETEAGEWELERVDFIHYAKPNNTGKPDKPGGGKPPKQESCYKLTGVKWKSLPVDYVVNPTNPDGLSENFVVSTISTSAETWDDETSIELFRDTLSVDYGAQYGVQNYVNAIAFGDNAPGVIAVTTYWFTRRGKQLVEFDIEFNTDYVWGDASVDPNVMDLINIATHELGHAVGMDDIYSNACAAVTMYGYSDYGDVEKRSLETPDVTGLQQMYGA